ncbi:MAG: PqqD family protein [Acidobacteriota bacterium]
MDLDAVLTRNPDAAYRVYDGEATVVLPEEGEVNVLNEIGSTVWDLIDGRRSLREIVEAIVARYQVGRERAERDVLEFAASLRARRMVS